MIFSLSYFPDAMYRCKLFFKLILPTLMVLLTAGRLKAQVNPEKLDQSLIEESIQAVLGTEDEVKWHQIEVPDKVQKALNGQLKIKSGIPDTLFLGTVADDKSKHYILPDIAPSRSEQFSYLLYFDASKKITGVDVLDYHENYGYEIDNGYFRDQFKDKSNADKIIFGRTIQNISGATISARSLTNSVHDLMLIINQIQLP